MPREVNTWKRTEPDNGFVLCWFCDGWGGEDQTQCYGFGAKEDWRDCYQCQGSGQLEEKYADYLKSSRSI